MLAINGSFLGLFWWKICTLACNVFSDENKRPW